MPRSGKDIDTIRQDAGITDREEFLEIVNKLGNKILLESNINRSIGKAWFKTKIQNSIKDKKGYKDSMFELPKDLISDYKDESDPMWTIEEINKKTEEIADRITNFIFN